MEIAVAITVGSDRLQGILHCVPGEPRVGLVVIVGGPQYRVGSHRQFVLLARALAARGHPVLRFDFRGMGDSTGAERTFEDVDDDIRAAIDHLTSNVPSLRKIVLWGLCDGASAACFYAPTDARVSGLVLLNPWVRTESGIAKTYLRHYYLQRVFSKNLWRRIVRGEFDLAASAESLLGTLKSALPGRWGIGRNHTPEPAARPQPLPLRMHQGLERFEGATLIVLSGDDLTAAEFRDMAEASESWQRLLSQPRFSRRELPLANHTFSRRAWRDCVSAWTLEFLDELNACS